MVVRRLSVFPARTLALSGKLKWETRGDDELIAQIQAIF
jgi:hypothetical protein